MSTPRHLDYDSLEGWAEGEHLPKDWTKHPNRDQWFKEYGELKQHLWQKHFATLNEAEQQEFKTGTHPSLSHKFCERAQPFTEVLREALVREGYGAEVSLIYYHMDRIILWAKLDRTPPVRLRGVPQGLPWLFRGFEVRYSFPDATC